MKADAEATRRRILESALALFSEHGPGGVSVRRIAAGAGVSLAMVHHYFGSKDDLYAACIDTMYDQIVELQPRLGEALSGGGELEELIDRIVRAAFRFARQHQVAMRLLMRQVMGAGELDPDRRARAQLPFLAQASQALGAMIGRPAAQLRLPLQSVVFLNARYAISSDTELEMFTGKRGEQALAVVEDHLVRNATALLEEYRNASH